MRPPPTMTLGMLCAAFAAAWLYELFAPPPAYSVPVLAAAPLPALPQPPMPFAAPPSEAFAAITERPLFDAKRKKFVPPPAPQPDKAPPPLPNLSLVGVIIDADRRMAMVKASDATLAMSVAVGQEIGGWQVSAIEPDRIVLKAGAAENEIRLEANRAPAQPAPQLPAAASGQPAPHPMGQQQSTQ